MGLDPRVGLTQARVKRILTQPNPTRHFLTHPHPYPQLRAIEIILQPFTPFGVSIGPTLKAMERGTGIGIFIRISRDALLASFMDNTEVIESNGIFSYFRLSAMSHDHRRINYVTSLLVLLLRMIGTTFYSVVPELCPIILLSRDICSLS